MNARSMPPSEGQANSAAADAPAQPVQKACAAHWEWHSAKASYKGAVMCRMSSIGRWTWACSRLQAHKRAWFYAILLLLACHATAQNQPDNR